MGAAASFLAASALILAAADFLESIDLIQTGQPTGFRIASGCGVVFDLVLASAFGLSSAAFLSPAEHRSRRLEVGATLAALGGSVGVMSAAVAAATTISLHYPSSFITSQAFVVAARFAAVFAAVAAARGFLSASVSAPDAIGRESWLGWAASGLAASYGLVMLSQIFLAHYLRRAGVTPSYTTGVGIAICGFALGLVAAAIAAFGFRGSRRRQRDGVADWLLRRDRMLGLATGAFAVAFLLVGIAAALETFAGPDNGFDTTKIAVLWLAVASSLGHVIASTCAASGFSRSASYREALPAARIFGGSTQPDAEGSEAERRPDGQ